jgi:pimeloyl-ACP methyl ester carboxylesterase
MFNKLRSHEISKILLPLICAMAFTGTAHSATAQVWTVLAADVKGDGRDPSSVDAAQLAFRYDKQQDVLWFRLSVYGKPNEQAFGVNIAFDTGENDAAKLNWWGTNNAFRFDKLLIAWVTRRPNGYQGMMGVGDAAVSKEKVVENLRQNNLQLSVEGEAIVIGVKRTDVTDKLKMKMVAAVGSNQDWNDDIPNAGAAMIDLSPEASKQRLREIDVGRNNLMFPMDYKTLMDNEPPVINKTGLGKQTLILISGMYSGAKSFAGFIARNQSQYKLFLVTPPGLNGTAPRAMPATGTSFSEQTWTRRLEQDVLNLIRQQKLTKPVIVAERQPAAQAAIELAIDHPDQIGGIILVGTNLVQFFPAPTDPTRKSPITFPDRVSSVDEGWGARWFKYVTPDTWRSGDLRPQLLSTDELRAQTAWEELESAPLQVKIRYLCEFWASDVTRRFDKLQIPVLALIPGFEEKFLADPANSFAKTAFLDSWETLVPKHPQVELVRIPDARMLVLDDQPKVADDAIGAFVKKVSRKAKD